MRHRVEILDGLFEVAAGVQPYCYDAFSKNPIGCTSIPHPTLSPSVAAGCSEATRTASSLSAAS